jgi:hypothetical protein
VPTHLGTVSAPLGGGRGVSPWDTPLYSAPVQVVKTFRKKYFCFFERFFLTVVWIVKRKVQADAKKYLKKYLQKD